MLRVDDAVEAFQEAHSAAARICTRCVAAALLGEFGVAVGGEEVGVEDAAPGFVGGVEDEAVHVQADLAVDESVTELLTATSGDAL
ncbi:hypothetical protein AB0O34_22965 [Sphaerisporangium sp. NPDC088356]|uniref:hypothetical protein n=1 Tax=Sphaerisporangium sp. NPDC088356 TaxID=3154871 RepID=UPI0034422812